MSPRSITQFSNLTKMMSEGKQKILDEIQREAAASGGETGTIPRMREVLNKTTIRKEAGGKIPASSSVGFQLNG